MDVVVVLAILALLAAVVAVLARPLRAGVDEDKEAVTSRVADLLATRDAKYTEIRELELDHRTGKLSDDEYRAQDRALRAEAIEVLRELDRLGADGPQSD